MKKERAKEYLEYIRNPHDTLFKEILGKEENAKEFLKEYLPSDILEIIEIESISIESESFITKELRRYYSDVLYKVKMQGEEGYIYILLEHKSYYERFVGLQVLEYMTKIWRRELESIEEESRGSYKLPFILPIVVYHGEKRQVKRIKMSEIIQVREERLKIYIPEFVYEWYNIREISEEKIRSIGLSELVLMLWLFKHLRDKELKEELEDLLKIILKKGYDKELLIKMCVYISSTRNDIESKELVELIESKLSYRIGGEIMGTLQAMILERERVAREEGIKEGIKEGEKKGEKKGIGLGIEIKFGQERLGIMEKIRQIENLEDLDKIGDMVRQAKDYEEFSEGVNKLVKEIKKGKESKEGSSSNEKRES